MHITVTVQMVDKGKNGNQLGSLMPYPYPGTEERVVGQM
jgi:hypothetical protein